MKTSHILFFIALFISYNFYSQSKNESLLIGSWSLHSRTYDNQVKKYETNFLKINFSKDKLFQRFVNDSKSEGRWMWGVKPNNEKIYSKLFIIVKNKKHRGIESYKVINLTENSLILSNEIGSKVSYTNYFRNEK